MRRPELPPTLTITLTAEKLRAMLEDIENVIEAAEADNKRLAIVRLANIVGELLESAR